MGVVDTFGHGLRTPSEDINQRNLKIWADWAKKYASALFKNLGGEVNFRPCSARTYLQLPLRQWGASNVYLLVLLCRSA